KKRLGINEHATALSPLLKMFGWFTKQTFGYSPNLSRVQTVSIVIMEQKEKGEVAARSIALMSRLPHILRAILLLAFMLYLIPITLFFFSTFGIAKALGIDNGS